MNKQEFRKWFITSSIVAFLTAIAFCSIGCDNLNCKPDIRFDKDGNPYHYGVRCGGEW